MSSTPFQQKSFLLLLFIVTLAFGWLLWPFFGAIFWGTILAIIFSPIYKILLNIMHQRQNWAALSTVLFCLIIVIFPLLLITISLFQQIRIIYQSIRSGEINLGAYFQQVMDALPPGIVNFLNRMGLANFYELTDMLSNEALQGSQVIAAEAVIIGQNAFEFLISFGIMIYLLFFLLRDGTILAAKIKRAIPLSAEHKRQLFNKFTTVVRATVKGNITVAAIQGALGGIIFAFLGIKGALLWGTVMAFLSLLPAGSSLIWGPVAIYFILTGTIWKGILLIIFGVLVIGLIDNILRPILVGKDIQVPDYVVFISTFGGIALLGPNGFVIGPVLAAFFIVVWDLFSTQATKEEDKT